MLVQRFTETALGTLAANGTTLAARANSQRILLWFLPIGSGTSTQLSTRVIGDIAKCVTICASAQNPQQLKLVRSTDGPLCTCEWYATSSGIMGGQLCVLEVIEEDTGQPRSDGGVILGEGPSWKQDALGQIQADTATMLLQSIRNAIPRSRNGRNENCR